MTTEPIAMTSTNVAAKSPKHLLYILLDKALIEGGFDKHMAALCKPFIASAVGPSWWETQPSSYFRILFVGYLEGIESEKELCWQVEESLLLRCFVGFDADTTTPDPASLAQVRQPLLPLIHNEAFDSLLRIIDNNGLLEGQLPGLSPELLATEPVVAVVQRIRSRDHQNYWKRLTKVPGASWAPQSSVPAPPESSVRAASPAPSGAREAAPFALWLEDLSQAQSAFAELRARGITDFKTHFANSDSTTVDQIVRACIYGRGPASMRAFLNATSGQSGRELPQQVTAETIESCKAIAVALAEGARQFGAEVPMLDAAGQPALVSIQLAVQPGCARSLESVLIAFTDITALARAREELASTPSFADEAIKHSRIGVWEWDVANDTTQWSDAMLRVYGLSRQEFTGRHSDYFDCTHPADRELQRESVRQSIVDGTGHTQRQLAELAPTFKDFRIRRKDGQIRWVRGSAIEMVDDEGRPVKMQGVLWDITQTKHSELELQDSEQQFRQMVEQAALPIVLEAFDGEVIYANDSAIAFFQIARDEIATLRASDYWEEPEQRAQALATLAAKGELSSFEARFRMGTGGEPHIMLMAARVIEHGGRNIILCHHQEITFSKCVEDQLRSGQQQAEEQLQQAKQQAEEQFATVRETFEQETRQQELRVEKARQQADEQSQAIRQHLQEQLRTAQQQAEAVQQQLETAQHQHAEQQRAIQQQIGGALAARMRELSLLKAMVIASEQDPSRLVELVCRELGQALALPLVLGALSTMDGSGLGIVAERIDSGQKSCVGKQLALSQAGLVGLFSEHPHPVWIGDASSDERAAVLREVLSFEAKSAALLLPLVVGNDIVGLLVLGTAVGQTLDADTLSLVGSITTHVARNLTSLGTSAACERLAAIVDRIRRVIDGDETEDGLGQVDSR